jgi:hypothetical protein
MYRFAYFRYVGDLWFKEKRGFISNLRMQRGARVYNFSGRNVKRLGMKTPIIFFPLMAMFILLLGTTLAGANTTYLESINTTHSIASISNYEQNHNLSIEKGIGYVHILCKNATFSNATITAYGNNRNITFDNCSFYNESLIVDPNSSIYIISPKSIGFSKEEVAENSNITIAYRLRINVFVPYGYNQSIFGSVAAGFAYVFPRMNYTINPNNDELLMGEFKQNSSFASQFQNLKKQIPFGAYGLNTSTIYKNETNASFGTILGSKTFLVPIETIEHNKIINYNPYEIDYSFLGFDQLVMFTLNITKDTNLTPIYIEPIYPKFNFYYIPDNGTRSIDIRYIIAVPPQDNNWNFTAYIYRYAPQYFVTNPREGIRSKSAFVKLLAIDDNKTTYANYTIGLNDNGTMIYFINYTTTIAIGINSSIITMNGTIPGEGSFIEDSTTPSFSFGAAYCSSYAHGQANPLAGIAMSAPGTYHMVKTLLPLYGDAIPLLAQGPCMTGLLVEGRDINVFCNGTKINALDYGIAVLNSSNINFYNCGIEGNGILINNSQDISFNNFNLTPSASNKSFAAQVINSQFVTFNNLSIGKGFSTLIGSFSSAGTPESSGMSINNLSVCNSTELDEIRGVAFVTKSRLTCQSKFIQEISEINPRYLLYILTMLLVLFYLLLFIYNKRRDKASREGVSKIKRNKRRKHA